MIKWSLQTLIPKIILQRLADFSGRHENHYLAPGRNRDAAQLGYRLWPFIEKYFPAEKRDVRSIYTADKNSSIVHSKRSQNSLLHLLSGSGRECENRR